MSDALPANTCHPFDTIVAYCNQHARGNFDDIKTLFPEQCGKVLALFSQIFKNERSAKEQGLDPAARLDYHRRHSMGPVIELFAYLRWLLEQELTEESAGMYKAARYMLKREAELTRFLHLPGVPLDSNAIERALKCAVLIRKNSMFYVNEVTAHNAAVLMTLAGTSVHNDGNPSDYLTALLDNEEAVKANPEAWFPWNYLDHYSSRDG